MPELRPEAAALWAEVGLRPEAVVWVGVVLRRGRSGTRRCCRGRRWARRGRRSLRRSALRGRLGFSIGTKLRIRLSLRHHQRCGLRVRRRATNCVAVRAVVANSTSRSFVMMVLVPREIFGNKVGRYTNKRRAALWRPENVDLFIFCKTESPDSPLFMAHSGDGFKPQATLSPAAYPTCQDSDPAQNPANHQFQRRSRDKACVVLVVLVPAIRPAADPATLRAGVLRRDPASAAAPRPRTSGRAFLRRLRRLSGLDRWILCWVDSHLHRHLAVVAEIGTRAGHSRCRHLDVAAAITAPRGDVPVRERMELFGTAQQQYFLSSSLNPRSILLLCWSQRRCSLFPVAPLSS